MTRVLGRTGPEGPTARLGRYLAPDGSRGAPVALDLERPHAGLVVGKRGYGKSYTLGVLAEGLADTAGVTGLVVDPMGVFAPLAADGRARVVERPRVPADGLPPPAWPALLDLDPTSAAGALLWRAAARADDLDGLRAAVEAAEATGPARRAALNHLDLAASWGVFAPDGLSAGEVLDGPVTVLDCSALDAAAATAVARVLVGDLYRTAVARETCPLPWVLADEAHVLFDGVAGPALRTVLTRGRSPGVSLVCATQRPAALPPVAVSQADLLVAHRLTSRADLDALARARPTYLRGSLADGLPANPGEALVVDDATETAHTVRVRERETPHGGESPGASDRRPG